MPNNYLNSFQSETHLEFKGKRYRYYSIKAAEKKLGDLSRLPFSLKILLENLLRHEDGKGVTVHDITSLSNSLKNPNYDQEIEFRPARVLMQDFTGVPAVVDLAAMRDAVDKLHGDSSKVNPLIPVDLVIDHSVMVDSYGGKDSFKRNVNKEYQRNGERYEFLKWGQGSFRNFRVVPPGTGICHQVNLEFLAQVVWSKTTGNSSDPVLIYPDTLVGTDSHTTMINGLAVLGWGVGGIEAEAAMLGQPISMTIPEVVGFKLIGKLREGVNATDLVLTVTQMLRKHDVVGKFVEFYGAGLSNLSISDRATIANMAPEYGATCGFFPIDAKTIDYLKFSGRDPDIAELVEVYAKKQGLWRDDNTVDPSFNHNLVLDMESVETSLAGPKRPQDRILLPNVPKSFTELAVQEKITPPDESEARQNLTHGSVVIAAITSCTNTSNPSAMIGAGLVARNAQKLGLKAKSWVKTSLAPGSQVVSEYLQSSGLQNDLDILGFNLVGYGCTTCIGNSGPLPEDISKVITDKNLAVASVLSGNRNFEGRIHPLVKANYLASPMLVVAYAIAGTVLLDLRKDPIGYDAQQKPIYLKDIWPSNVEISEIIAKILTPEMFRKRYSSVFQGDEAWRGIATSSSTTYKWNSSSTYVKKPPYFENYKEKSLYHSSIIHGARILAILGDSVTTDHISPAGDISLDSPASEYLQKQKIPPEDFNSYGARRGNHEVMMRGTFANIRLRNELVPEKSGGYTKIFPNGNIVSIYDAAMQYQKQSIPLVIIAGKEYGTGSSRDWAAKGTNLLGVRAVIAESFERIHRSNLVGMGVLPLVFTAKMNRASLNLTGEETFDIIDEVQEPKQNVNVKINYKNGSSKTIQFLCRIDTARELDYFHQGGILQYVLKNL